MKRLENKAELEGYLYDHNLQKKTVTRQESKYYGVTFISGKIDVATDDDCTNIVSVWYRFVTPTTSKGKANPAYNALVNICDGNYKTVMNSSKEEALKVRINTSIDLNEFYGTQNGTLELVSTQRYMDGFIHPVNGALNADEDRRNMFEVDMLITHCSRKPADEDRGIPEKVIVKGAIFNDYKKAVLPVEFTAFDEDAMNYFEDLGASSKEPVFTKLWGKQVSSTVVRRKEEETAFGGNYVREVTSTRKDFVITRALAQPYVWDDENSMTASELKEMMSNREMYLATLKQRAITGNRKEEKRASEIPSGDYEF